MFHDRIAEARFAELQKQYGFQWCIETGTHLGVGSFRASQYCNVCTIDTNREFQKAAIENWLKDGCTMGHQWDGHASLKHGKFKIVSNIGNSPEGIRIMFDPKTRKREVYCFYLDAHWGAYWPLLDELKVIADFGLSDSVIIIHDFKVPGKDFAYDHYGVDLDYNYVKDALAAINPNYRIEYNDKCDPRDEPYSSARGILYALP